MDALAIVVRYSLAMLAASVIVVSSALADDVDVQTVIAGLKNPTGVAIRPSGTPTVADAKAEQGSAPYEIVVCESGAGRVRSVPSDQPDKPSDLITGFPTLSGSGDSSGDINPDAAVGVYFLDHHRVVVGSGNVSRPTLRLYDIGGIAIPPIAAEKPTQGVLLPRSARPSPATAAVGYSLSRTMANDKVGDLLIVSSPQANSGSALWKVLIRADTLDKGDLIQLVGQANEPKSYPASTVGPSGYIVAVESGQAGKSSQLAFINPIDASVAMLLPIELSGIVSLAYSPQAANLYAAAKGGIYRLDAAGTSGESSVKVVQVADVDRPSALAFGPDGSLYVTDLDGALLKLSGKL